MAMNGLRSSLVKRLATASLMAIIACGVATGVRAQEEGELVKNVLGKMGFIPEDKDPIHYRERAPLVLPPNANKLPPPIEGGYGERKLTNWPNDPDAAAARKRAANAATPRTQTEEYIENQRDGRVSPDKLRARTAGRDPNDRTPVNPQLSGRAAGGWMEPDELRATGSKYQENVTPPGEEPSRQVLSDPPKGYRKAAGGGTIKPTYDAPETMDPASPYYVEYMRRKRASEN